MVMRPHHKTKCIKSISKSLPDLNTSNIAEKSKFKVLSELLEWLNCLSSKSSKHEALSSNPSTAKVSSETSGKILAVNP
jgi:hypothetical protein